VLRAAKDDPDTPLLALYRCAYRASAGGGCVVALEGGRPLSAVLFAPERAPKIDDPLRLAWPWDVAAFTFGFWPPEDARGREGALAAVFSTDFDGEGLLAHWEEVCSSFKGFDYN
jgi:hypothetical protein